MAGSKIIMGVVLLVCLGTFVTVGLLAFFPWASVNWGSVTLASANTITVTGTAELEEKTQIANFTAGASAVSDDKQAAIDEVNGKIDAVIAKLQQFGIGKEDLKTQNLTVYQQQEQYYEEGRQKSRPGQWHVDNSLSITLRDVDRASDLVDLLTSSGVTNVYGPNFTFDDTSATQNTLLAEAVADAREKADLLADASGRKVTEVVSINEGFNSPVYPFFARGDSGGGGAPIEPGTGTVSVSVTVVFAVE